MAEEPKPVEPIVQEHEDGSAVFTIPEGEFDTGQPPAEPAAHAEGGAIEHDNGEEEEEGDETLRRDSESKRQDRREERARKKEARNLAIERAKLQQEHNEHLRAEVEALKRQLAEVAQRTSGTEIQNAKQQLSEAKMEEIYWKGERAKARTANNAEAESDAEDKLYNARRRSEALAAAIENAERVRQAPPRQNGPDPVVLAKARAWHAEHPWYVPNGTDDDSQTVLAFDKQVAAAGFKPESDAYYQELNRRIAKYLPHRANGATTPSQDQPSSGPPRVPVTSSGRDTPNGGGKTNEFRLSADRVKAMKDAGVWDDPKQRAAMAKRYAQHDAQNRGRNG